jgi:hypothetical protein
MAAVLGHAGTDLLREHFSEYAPADNLYDEYGVSKVSTVNQNTHSHVNHFKVRLNPHAPPSSCC